MSSLWTPEGERRVEASPEETAVEFDHDDTDGFDESDERRRVEAEMAGLEAELLAAPIEDVVANHCYGLFQLAALHLGQQPPNLPAARLAIDAFGAVVENVGDRLGQAGDTLRDGLAQLRLAFVQISAAIDTGYDASAGAPEAEDDPDTEDE